MYRVHKEIGSKPRQPVPRFESTELPEWLVAIHRREQQTLEAHIAAAQVRHVGKHDDMVITHDGEPETEIDNETPE